MHFYGTGASVDFVLNRTGGLLQAFICIFTGPSGYSGACLGGSSGGLWTRTGMVYMHFYCPGTLPVVGPRIAQNGPGWQPRGPGWPRMAQDGSPEAQDGPGWPRMAALGCSGLLWAALGCSGLHWAGWLPWLLQNMFIFPLTCALGLLWAALGCSGLLWAALGCLWAALGWLAAQNSPPRGGVLRVKIRIFT